MRSFQNFIILSIRFETYNFILEKTKFYFSSKESWVVVGGGQSPPPPGILNFLNLDTKKFSCNKQSI